MDVSNDNHRKHHPVSYAASPAQRQLWFLNNLIPDKKGYHISLVFRILGDVDHALLERSVNNVVKRHESLRTSFHSINGEPRQVIAASVHISMTMVDLLAVKEIDLQGAIQRFLREDGAQSFELSRCPLLRVALLRFNPTHHVLVFTVHHIVFDGWSVNIFVREMSASYTGLLSGKRVGFAELETQYRHYSTRMDHWLKQEKLRNSQLAYWKNNLSGVNQNLELPTDYPRPSIQTFNGSQQEGHIAKSLTDALRSLSREENVTLYMTLLSAFAVLLHKYTGQKDIIIGSPLQTRQYKEDANVIGFFINTLPMCVNVNGDPTFRELMNQVREVSLEAFEHRDIPFDRIVRAVQPDRHLTSNPIYQIVLSMQDESYRLELPGTECSRLFLGNCATSFDLVLDIRTANKELHLSLEYNSDLFKAATIRRLAGHFATLLSSICENPQQRICDLAILSEVERHQLLVEWNDTATPYDQDKCIHQLFEEQAIRTPEAAAAVCGPSQLTYEQLDRKANQLARYLRKQGVSPATPVGLCVGRSLDMIVGLLGILKAGGYYVPLDPAFPVQRILTMIVDAKVGLVLTEEALQEKFRSSDSATELVCLDRDWQLIAKEPTDPICSGVSAEDIAYVIYTSGSTGRPKGIVVNHRPVINLIEWVNREFKMGPGDRILFVTSVCFDLSVYDVFGILAAGGAIHIATEAQCQDPEQLLHLLCNEPITFWDSAPAALQQLVPLMASNALDSRASQLRLVFLSGDWIPVSLPDTLRDLFPQSRIIALGGATEATVWSNYYPIETVDPSWSSIPYGRPIQNAQYYILDNHFDPCPIGVPGNLYIGGDCLCSGYIDAVQTAERFIDHPFSSKSEARLYHTGDRARYFSDGNIEFLGRIDQQVKIRGFRIELGEIEFVLGNHADVQESLVIACEDTNGDKRLIAYIVPKADQNINPTDLRKFLSEHLPDYMLPGAFMPIQSLPVTLNGKVNREALPAPEYNRSILGQLYVPPRNSTEEVVARIWNGILDTGRIGIHDNFFELGGHSFLLLQMQTRIRTLFGINLPVRSLFEGPTIAKIAEWLMTHQVHANHSKTISEVLHTVDRLSEDEIDALLAAKLTTISPLGPGDTTEHASGGSSQSDALPAKTSRRN